MGLALVPLDLFVYELAQPSLCIPNLLSPSCLKKPVRQTVCTPYAEMPKFIYVLFISTDWDFSCPGLLYHSPLHIICTLGRSVENSPPLVPGKRFV